MSDSVDSDSSQTTANTFFTLYSEDERKIKFETLYDINEKLQQRLHFNHTSMNLNENDMKFILNNIMDDIGILKVLQYIFNSCNKSQKMVMQNSVNDILTSKENVSNINNDSNDNMLCLPDVMLSRIVDFCGRNTTKSLKLCCYKLAVLCLKKMVSYPIRIAGVGRQYYCKFHCRNLNLMEPRVFNKKMASFPRNCFCNEYRYYSYLKMNKIYDSIINNSYWNDIPSDKKIILPYPNLFNPKSNEYVINILSKYQYKKEHFIIMNKDDLLIPMELDLNNVSKVFLLDCIYGNNIISNLLIDCQWKIEFLLKKILNNRLNLNIKPLNNGFKQYRCELRILRKTGIEQSIFISDSKINFYFDMFCGELSIFDRNDETESDSSTESESSSDSSQ